MPEIKVDDLSEALPSLQTTAPDVAPDQAKSKGIHMIHTTNIGSIIPIYFT